MNLLLVTLDQFRGDCLSSAGHSLARTPNLDRLAAAGVRFNRHYSQAAPCSPGRACLYTGTYQMNNRVVANGTPLDDGLDNLARAARRAGFDPTLFGYSDQGVDPRTVTSPEDPRLSSYEGVLPGFSVGLDLTGEHAPWIEWLRDLGYDVPSCAEGALSTEPERPEDVGVSAFTTNRYLDWLERRTTALVRASELSASPSSLTPPPAAWRAPSTPTRSRCRSDPRPCATGSTRRPWACKR